MKILKEYFHSCFGKNVDWRLKILRFIMLLGLFWCFSGFFFLAFLYQRPLIALCAFGCTVLIALVFYSTFRMKDYSNLYMGFFLLMNGFFYPNAFFLCGGIESSIPLWLLMGFTLVFLFLDGWRMYVLLVYTLVVDVAIYAVSLAKPEFVSSVIGYTTNAIMSCVSLLFIGGMVGGALKRQIISLKKEKQLSEERRQEIEGISDSKSLFFANMSHEIRTPINTIIGLNEMILRENVSEEVAENAVNIQNASKILLALINDILDLSKMESGKMEIVPAQYETASMFSDLVNIIWVRANQKKLEFKIDIAEDIPSMLYGDEVRIKQVLTNILTNAVKYTEKGSVTLTVTGEQVGDNLIRLKIAVEDTGIGIRKENLEDLFTVFKRVDQEKTKKIEGTGLGLALSKQLVEMMGGTIKVDSIYQKGSCFTVTIDQQIMDHSPLGSMHYAAKRGAQNRKKYSRSFEAPNAHVLVVDDNEMNLLVAKKLLRDTKVQVELAASGKECLEKTKENNYHVILMDHMMPEMDGEETLRILRSCTEGYCQKAPVIALTANVMTNAAQWYQERGFDGYLAKPISGSLLEAVLLKFLPGELIEYGGEDAGETEVPEYSAMLFHKKKKKIAICAECVCDLPQEWVEKFDIKLMYYYVITEEGRFIDTREIGSMELMEYMAGGKSAVSSAAPMEEYEAFLADRLLEAEQVIFITIASNLNNHGYANAVQAAKNFDNVTVFNSGHLSSGMGLVVLKAAQMAADGVEKDDIIKELTQYKEKVSTSFTLLTVDNMYQNHRIDQNVWKISKALQMHPIIRVTQNQFSVGGFTFGTAENMAKRYIRKQLRHAKKIDTDIVFVTYVGLNIKQLEEIRKEILKYVKFEIIRFQKASATISSNCGMGTFGLLYVKK